MSNLKKLIEEIEIEKIKSELSEIFNDAELEIEKVFGKL